MQEYWQERRISRSLESAGATRGRINPKTMSRAGAALDAAVLFTDIGVRTNELGEYLRIDVYANPTKPDQRYYVPSQVRYVLRNESFVRIGLYADDARLEAILREPN